MALSTSPLAKFLGGLKDVNWRRHRYWVLFLVAAVWMVVFDQYNLRSQLHVSKQVSQLEADRDHFAEAIKEAQQQTHELNQDSETLERVAREQYLMKRKNEDLFIVIDPSKAPVKKP